MANDRTILQEARRLTDRALTLLTMHDKAAFLSAFVLQRPPVFSDSVGTAAVTAKADLLLSPTWVAKVFQDAQQAVFVLGHEALHVMFDDVGECGERDPELWNIACDAWNNAQLIAAKIGTMPPRGVLITEIDALSMTKPEIYEYLKRQGGAAGGQGGELQGDLLEAIADAAASPQSKEAVKAEIRSRIAGALLAAKIAGAKPGLLERRAEETLQVKTPWQRIMSEFFHAMATRELSWSKPNRRHIGQRRYFPGYTRAPSIGALGLVIDVSGSVTQQLLNYFGAHFNALLEQTLPDSVVLAYCDTEVRKSQEVTADELPLVLETVGGGGTNMPAALDWMAAKHSVDVCVVLTDGYTPWPSRTYPFPVLWGITTSVVPPKGRWVHIEGAS